jgi:hypothetical protein
MRYFIVFILCVIGLFVGYGVWNIEESGYFIKWEIIPTIPGNIVELLPGSGSPFSVKTSNGSIFRYENWHNQGWIEEKGTQNIPFSSDVNIHCDMSSPEFTFLSNYPTNIKSCIQEKVIYMDGFMRYAFILDSNGNIWQWNLTRTPDSLINLIWFSCIGIIIGLSIGIIGITILHKDVKLKMADMHSK